MILEPVNKELVARALDHRKQDADLLSLGDEKVLAKLAGTGREAWRRLWDDVDAQFR